MNFHITMKNRLIKKLQKRLTASASYEKRKWFNNYLKGAIEYRGVTTPKIDSILRSWIADCAIDRMTQDEQTHLMRLLFAEKFAEDKFAAILWLKQRIVKQPPKRTLAFVEGVFKRGEIFDWSTNDWLCVRVIDPLVLKSGQSAERVAGWRKAKNLWQRRSSIVGFRGAARAGIRHELIAEIIEDMADSQERFVQTGIGWCLADMSRDHPQTAQKLFERHFARLSLEVIDRHAKHLPEHKEMKARKRKEII